MVNFYWWGMYIRVSHEQTQTLLKLLGSGAAIDGLFAAIGVPAFAVALVATAIAFTAGWIAASDDGNGVAFDITWAGWLWIENPPPGA